MSPYASVVIRCCNEEQHIGRLLTGILQQNIKDVEIIVVDSGSTDATVSNAKRYPVKILHIQPYEFSFGRSLNIGCHAARGEFIIIASSHVYPLYEDWLERLLDPFSDPKVALVYGKQRGNETTKYSEHQVFAKWFPDESKPYQDHPFCNNANAAIRRAFWEKLPYDETLTGLEDIEWAKRALDLGYKIAYTPDAEIIHVHDERFRQIFNRYRREAIAMRRIFPHEHFNLWDFVRLCAGNIISDFRHAKHDGAIQGNIISILLFRLMQFGGTYRGYNQRSPVTDQLRQRFYYPKGFKRSISETKEYNQKILIDYTGSQRGNDNDTNP